MVCCDCRHRSGDAKQAATQCLTYYLLPRQVWLTPVQGLCTVTHGLLAVCECQTLHATRAAIKIEYGLQLSMTYSSGDSNIKKHCATVGA